MRTRYFHALSELELRLKQEQENYVECLNAHKEFWQLKKIKQRIRSLRNLLQSMENEK